MLHQKSNTIESICVWGVALKTQKTQQRKNTTLQNLNSSFSFIFFFIKNLFYPRSFHNPREKRRSRGVYGRLVDTLAYVSLIVWFSISYPDLLPREEYIISDHIMKCVCE